ncbi:hypothetical protein BX661DRAFT_176054 [Kickxella alabastrina]|uniref:uncharacterized protein n=1 Tax=Kickxella alabastrina TaxID=61397 RepID=UPI00221F76A8|nr:uncharacterized protein BX661DRAFT_176054 [Kickxella alabastrina]KAI7835081.1 hypothetical protein BX661DRAFT_176054 [Kickxella alabastrina]
MTLPFNTVSNFARPKDNRPNRFAYDFGSIDPGMFTPAPERNIPKRAPKRTLSYTIPLPDDNLTAANSDEQQGHVLGVNALALSFDDPGLGGTLYSGGRDGVVKAWDLNAPMSQVESIGGDEEEPRAWAIDRHRARQRRARTTLRASRVVHSDWVNDLAVVNGGATVVSASSDQTVRAWTPGHSDSQPATVGSHLDYVKALAFSAQNNTIISGGLDRTIKLWDITRATEAPLGPVRAVREFGGASLLSVYALACNASGSLVVSGSPEKVMRLWDPREARQLATLSGHTDHIRAVLLSADSELVLSGSSDTTVKLWSLRMRRCLSTFAQHTDSVWALHSAHPRFATFYSAGRDGLVTKTIGAGAFADEGPTPRRMSVDEPRIVCVAVAKEQHGVVKLVAADDAYVWTATKGTTLNRWLDVGAGAADAGATDADTDASCSLIEPWQSPGAGHRRTHTIDCAGLRIRPPPECARSPPLPHATVSPVLRAICAEQARLMDDVAPAAPLVSHSRSMSAGTGLAQQFGSLASILTGVPEPRVPMAGGGGLHAVVTPESPLPLGALLEAAAPSSPHSRGGGNNINGLDSGVRPVRAVPDETICGRHGLRRHKVLQTRRHVLAQDTLGRVSLWDIMLCRRLHEFPDSDAGTDAESGLFQGICGRDLDAIHAAISSEPESVQSWCHVDTRVGALTVHMDETQVWAAEVHVDEVDGVAADAVAAMGDHERVNIGQWMLKRLFLAYARNRVRRGPLPRADAALLNRWATQVPAAAVVPARAPQPQRGAHPELSKTASTPHVSTLLQAQLPGLKPTGSQPQLCLDAARSPLPLQGEDTDALPGPLPSAVSQLCASTQEIGISASISALPSPAEVPAPELPRIVQTSTGHEEDLGDDTGDDTDNDNDNDNDNDSNNNNDNGNDNDNENVNKNNNDKDAGGCSSLGDGGDNGRLMVSGDANERLLHLNQQFSELALPGGSPSHHNHHSHNPSIDSALSTAQQQPSNAATAGKAADAESNANAPTGKFMTRLLSMRVRRQKSTPVSQAIPLPPLSSTMPGHVQASGSQLSAPALPSTHRTISTPDPGTNGSSSMDSVKRAIPVPPPQPERDEFAEWAGPRYPTDTERTLALLQQPPAAWDQLYSPVICPRLPLPHSVIIHIYQNHSDASEPYAIYRNTVAAFTKSSLGATSMASHGDLAMSVFRVSDDPLLSFELCMPAWLTDFLLFNRLPASYQEPAKVSFVLTPTQSTALPPFPQPNARLVANRMLRARKLAVYVVDKLGLPLMVQPAPNYINAVEACLRSYLRMMEGQMQVQGADTADQIVLIGNKYVDAFRLAGETLGDTELAALVDMVEWQEIMQVEKNDRGDSSRSKGDLLTVAFASGNGRKEEDADDDEKEEQGYIGRPELYLDLYCKGQKLRPKQTLATIKTHVWKSSGDVQVNYDWAEFVKTRIAKAQSLAAQSQN